MAHKDDDTPPPPHVSHLNGSANGKLPTDLRNAVKSASDAGTSMPLSERLMDLIRRIRKMSSED